MVQPWLDAFLLCLPQLPSSFYSGLDHEDDENDDDDGGDGDGNG